MTDQFPVGRAIQVKARGLAESLIRSRKEMDITRVAVAFGRIITRVRRILLQNLLSAIEQTKEFDIEPLKASLIGVFQDDDIFKVGEDGIIYSLAEEIAGDENDFFDGIAYARSVLGLGKLDKESAAKFWRNFIYRPYREGITVGSKKISGMTLEEYADWAYNRTIDARMDGWHGKVPYWNILENGNSTSSLAYPNFPPTHFLQDTIFTAQQALELELLAVDDEIENIIAEEVVDFVDNPETYSPGTILDRFIVAGKRYYIYVTKTKRLGVAQRPRV